MRLPKIVWIAVGVLFAAVSAYIQYEVKVRLHHRQAGGSKRELGNLKLGDPAPDFSSRDLSEGPVSLVSYRGRKVVLLDFWATWCGPCRMAMPGLQSLHDEFKDRGLEILSVNQDEPAVQVRHFINRKKYTVHVILDPDSAIGHRYGVRGIPTLVVVDKQGLVQWLQVGYSQDQSELRQLLERLTKE